VAFSGPLDEAYRACLWSRLASRVVLVLAHVPASTSDELYESLRDLPWEDHLLPSVTFAVDAHGTNRELRNTQFIALRTKDSVCDRLVARVGGRPGVDTSSPDLRIVVRLHNSTATVGLDLSGEPLFHRGYERTGWTGPRRTSGPGRGTGRGRGKRDEREVRPPFAPMRADYASALLASGSWFRACRHDAPELVALYPGSGVLLAEAAAQALDRAPGLVRTRWGFEGWSGHSEQDWQRLVDEADRRAEAGAGADVSLIAIDDRRGSANACRDTLRSMGLACSPTFASSPAGVADLSAASLAILDLSWIAPTELAREAGALSSATAVADAMGEGTPIVSLATSDAIDSALGVSPTQTTEVYLGSDTAAIRSFADGASASGDHGDSPRTSVTLKDRDGAPYPVPVLVSASDQFAARLAKVARQRAKWARREDVTCYRVYDADLPDYAVSIDLYHGSEGSRYDRSHTWLVVSEYAAPSEIDADLAHRRLLDVLTIAPKVLDVDPADVSVRVRERARGGSQYSGGGKLVDDAPRKDADAKATTHLVDEGGLTFEVNLSDRLDTGLFLDHRDVRAQVREMAKQTVGSKRFLNLFAYTGTATCYAADGGAKHTTTVDMSRPYLDWARRNMRRNGFNGPDHEYVQTDVIGWVSDQRRTANRWDLVFCDPPTFSNSSRMRSGSFDVQRDHAELLIGVSRLLTRNGVCLFSCNLRGFEPDVEKLSRYGVEIEDVTEGTIPEDFSRNAKIHHCYLVRRTPEAK
jgi:23S rRNA (guanine2445-N2)-methyltransferase / 23S rRNA (guanine2069-N7)-methyltransferase